MTGSKHPWACDRGTHIIVTLSYFWNCLCMQKLISVQLYIADKTEFYAINKPKNGFWALFHKFMVQFWEEWCRWIWRKVRPHIQRKKLQSRVVAQRAPNVACSVALWHSFFVPSLIEISPYLQELWAESALIGPHSKCHKTTANAILGTHRTCGTTSQRLFSLSMCGRPFDHFLFQKVTNFSTT